MLFFSNFEIGFQFEGCFCGTIIAFLLYFCTVLKSLISTSNPQHILLTELTHVQKVIAEKGGDPFLSHVANVVMPAVRCPPELSQQYCFHLKVHFCH